MNNKVVLAFSGGLDTSFCVPYLKNEKGLEVHTVMVNTGGFSPEEEKTIEERALKLGAASHTTINAVDVYYRNGLRYLIYGNILKNATYPLSVSSERAFQAMEVLNDSQSLLAKVEQAVKNVGKQLDKPVKKQVKADIGRLRKLVAKCRLDKVTEAEVTEMRAAKTQLENSAAGLV